MARWRTATQDPGQGEAADPRPGPVDEQAPARNQMPARDQTMPARNQMPARDQTMPARNQMPARDQMPARNRAPASELWTGSLRDQGRDAADRGAPRTDRHGRRAVLSYLSIPFLGILVPLAVYLITPWTSVLARRHAAQALNLSITVLLYEICALILGGLLALDTVMVAVLVTAALLAALWLVTLVYLVLAGTAANRGDYYRIPGWLCATMLRGPAPH